MNLAKGFLKWKKLVAVGVIVLPWFFKDQLAASMDQKSEVAQQALAEKNQQMEIQDQAKDQREVLTRLREIQRQLDVVDAKAENASQDEIDARLEKSDLDLMSSYFEDEGKALSKSEETFEDLLGKVDVEPDRKKELEGIASEASATADKLRGFDGNPDAQQIDPLYIALDNAHNKLTDGYDKLEDAANNQWDGSASLARVFRGLAWICTAIGALLLGDWRKLFGGADDEEGEEARKPSESHAAAV